ncbi:HAD family hydrolase, partial [Pseudomonas brassicae]
DLLMARNAGMHSVAVGHGAMSLDALSVYEPQLSIQHFSQLQAWLSRACAIEFPG